MHVQNYYAGRTCHATRLLPIEMNCETALAEVDESCVVSPLERPFPRSSSQTGPLQAAVENGELTLLSTVVDKVIIGSRSIRNAVTDGLDGARQRLNWCCLFGIAVNGRDKVRGTEEWARPFSFDSNDGGKMRSSGDTLRYLGMSFPVDNFVLLRKIVFFSWKIAEHRSELPTYLCETTVGI